MVKKIKKRIPMIIRIEDIDFKANLQKLSDKIIKLKDKNEKAN